MIVFLHVKELQYRSFYCVLSFICTFCFCSLQSYSLVYLCIRPFLPSTTTYIVIDITEAFSTTMSVCFFISAVCSGLYALYSFSCFFLPSFFLFERKLLQPYTYAFFISMVCSHCVMYCLLLPVCIEFFLKFQIQSLVYTLHFEARLSSYVMFTIKALFGGFCLGLIPLLTFILYTYNVLHVQFLCNNRKYFAFFFLLLASALSPPDILYQCFFTFVCFLYYECIIYVGCVYFHTNFLTTDTLQ